MADRARRLRARAALALIAGAVLVAAAGTPARAVGAQGVELEPLLGRRDGALAATIERDGQPIALRVRNTTEVPQVVDVTAALVHRADDGTPSLGAPIGWIAVDGGADVRLGPGETRELVAAVDLDGYRAAGTDDIAFVLAVDGGGNVVAQAAAIVRLRDGGAQLPLPVALLVLATALLAVVAGAWVRVATGRRGSARDRGAPA